MSTIKKLLPYIALAIFCFAPMLANAQGICVFDDDHKYEFPYEVIKEKGDNVDFVDFCCEELGLCTNRGFTPRSELLTHIAAKYKKYEALKYFVESRRIYFSHPDGYSILPIMNAAATGYSKTTRYLLDKGVDVTVKDEDGCDALCYAKKAVNPDSGLLEMVQKAWNRAKGISAAETRRNTDGLIRLLSQTDMEKELKNFKKSFKLDAYFS